LDLKKLVMERANLWEEQKALLDLATERGTDLSGEEQTEYDRRDSRMTEIDKIVDRQFAAEKRAAEAEATYADLQKGKPENAVDPTQNDKLRAFFRGESGRAFEVRATNVANSDGTVSSSPGPRGQYTVAPSFHSQLLEHLIETSAILSAGPTMLSTEKGEPLTVAKTATYSSAALVAEEGTIPASNPTFGQALMNAYKYGLLMQISSELLNDSAFDLQSFLARQAGTAMGNAFGTHLVTGDGDDKPTGLLHASSGITAGVTGLATVFKPTVAQLFDLYYSIITPYRNGSGVGWLMKDESMSHIRQLQDGSGQYLFAPALVTGAPNSILGKPVYTDYNMPAYAAAAKAIVFGDFSQYWVRRVDAFRFERSDDFAFNTDMTTYRCLMRADGKLIGNSSALKLYVGGAAS
jgi:HK97 family phage major capsid protein